MGLYWSGTNAERIHHGILSGCLNTSELVSVILTSPDIFFYYDKLFKDMYADLSGKVKVNHIFTCSSDNPEVTVMELCQSNLEEQVSLVHKVGKKSRKLRSPVEVQAYSAHLKRMNYVGMNPYKVIIILKNDCPNIPPEFCDNILYIKPTAAQWAMVKVERLD